ncbi:hypothetical protein BH10ACT1_BH10ACT1_07750 [soil metagenome]
MDRAGVTIEASDGSPAHVDSLDGLRAIAVMAVMAHHAEIPHLLGGFLGVDVFFVLSGFLITNLIAGEAARSGSVWWLGFYVRRALRLLPAMFVVVGATLVMVWVSRGAITSADLHRVGQPGFDVWTNTVKEAGAGSSSTGSTHS